MWGIQLMPHQPPFAFLGSGPSMELLAALELHVGSVVGTVGAWRWAEKLLASPGGLVLVRRETVDF